jgi:hypothetical protein
VNGYRNEETKPEARDNGKKLKRSNKAATQKCLVR